MKKILIVDDSPTVIHVAYDELEDAGYVVEVAYDGAACLKWLADNQNDLPDLIVLDIEMPKMTGDQCAEVIKTSEAWKHIPCVALTSRAPDSIGEHLAYFDNYLVKPFGFNELKDLIVRMIGPAE